MYIDIDKSHTDKVKYLGMTVSTNGPRMDPAKIETVENWPTPRSVKDILLFLGFANFHRMFIEGFGRIAYPLTEFTNKSDKPFVGSEDCQAAFERLQLRFVEQPVLQPFNPDADTCVEVDVSDYVVAGVPSQMNHDGKFYPVAYFSKKVSPAECNSEISDKELLAIVRAVETRISQYRPGKAYQGPVRPSNVGILDDYQTTSSTTSEVEWIPVRVPFSDSRSSCKHRTRPNSLTRRPGDKPKDPDTDERVQHQYQVVLKPCNLLSLNSSISTPVRFVMV